MEVLNKVFDRLLEDIVKIITEYTGKLTYRNGAFVRLIPDPDANYSLLLERMRFQRYRRFLRTMSFVTIQLPNVDKEICHNASKDGLKVAIYTYDDVTGEDIENILFRNYGKTYINS